MAMRLLQLDGIALRIDHEATRAIYESLVEDSCASCGCEFCRNWINARPYVHSAAFVAFLEQFGISPDREAEVSFAGFKSDGQFPYNGWYHFVGEIADVKEQPLNLWIPPCGVNFTSELLCVYDRFRGLPTMQLDFSTTVPWLLPNGPAAAVE